MQPFWITNALWLLSLQDKLILKSEMKCCFMWLQVSSYKKPALELLFRTFRIKDAEERSLRSANTDFIKQNN